MLIPARHLYLLQLGEHLLDTNFQSTALYLLQLGEHLLGDSLEIEGSQRRERTRLRAHLGNHLLVRPWPE